MIGGLFSVLAEGNEAKARAARKQELAIREMQKMRTAPQTYREMEPHLQAQNSLKYLYSRSDCLSAVERDVSACLLRPGAVDALMWKGEYLPIVWRKTPIPEVSREKRLT